MKLYISKLIIHNFKLFKDICINMNESVNIFVGENDSGKTTILEALSMGLTGKINGYSIMSKLNADWFNLDVRNQYKDKIVKGEDTLLPKIDIEMFFAGLSENDSFFNHYRGSNNSLREDAIGVKISIKFNDEYCKTYKQLLKEKKIIDIPVELYKVEFSTFAQPDYYITKTVNKIAIIDTTKKDYGTVLNRFVSNSIANYLSEEDETNLRLAYRGNRKEFINSPVVADLNSKLKEEYKFGNREIGLNLKEGEIDDWKNEMSLSVDKIPFENAGFGTQNMIKSEMVFNQNIDVDFLILEEPENNLSYSNMSILISKLADNKSKQLFISTHSSFVANKLGLNHLHLVSNMQTMPLTELPKEAYDFFVKLPGYNTLRVLLANKIILVEGPADELIIQRAYLDTYKKMPIDDGIDVMSVNGTAFKSYCELAKLIEKKIVVVTDNDGSLEKVHERYNKYNDVISLCVEEDENLNTLEPSVLNANKEKFNDFKTIIYKGKKALNYDGLCEFMLNNKAEWAMRVFQSEERISYPTYIKKAIGVNTDE